METIGTVYNLFFGTNQSSLKEISEHNILNIASNINSLFKEFEGNNEFKFNFDFNNIQLPKLVTIGAQSAAKSTVLESIMGLSFLPKGENMVTRCPADIKLCNIKENLCYVEFGDYTNEGWIVEKKFNIVNYQAPLQTELSAISAFIDNKTKLLAGTSMNISYNPIYIRVYSPIVPNIQLIDLPGIVMIPRTDEGQSNDIVKQIKDLIKYYIDDPKTIILAVIPSRTDLETDIGLAYIKECNSFNRTIGILTKPDRMNDGSHIGNYLIDNISKDLKLGYGYYVVKNKTQNTTEDELKYFSNHNEYKKDMYKEKTGYPKLIKKICNILVTSIRENLPNVTNALKTLDEMVSLELSKLGNQIPNSKEAQLAEINNYINNLCNKINDCIESSGSYPNIGREISLIFTNYRSEINNIKPFLNNKKLYSDAFFKDMQLSFEGYHMTHIVSPVKIIERCITDKNNDPLKDIFDISIKYNKMLIDKIHECTKTILNDIQFNKYPNLALSVHNSILNEILMKQQSHVDDFIVKLIKKEKCYIWTDDNDFKTNLEKIKNFTEYENLLFLLESYFNTIKQNFKNNLPGYMFSFIIRDLQNNITQILYSQYVKEEKIGLLKEDPKIETKRKYFSSIKSRIILINNMFIDK